LFWIRKPALATMAINLLNFILFSHSCIVFRLKENLNKKERIYINNNVEDL
jgi:hypothetical protein